MNWSGLWVETDLAMSADSRSKSIDMTANWTSLPLAWQWNSEFVDNNWETDYNFIRIWDPIQIEIWNSSK